MSCKGYSKIVNNYKASNHTSVSQRIQTISLILYSSFPIGVSDLVALKFSYDKNQLIYFFSFSCVTWYSSPWRRKAEQGRLFTILSAINSKHEVKLLIKVRRIRKLHRISMRVNTWSCVVEGRGRKEGRKEEAWDLQVRISITVNITLEYNKVTMN